MSLYLRPAMWIFMLLSVSPHLTLAQTEYLLPNGQPITVQGHSYGGLSIGDGANATLSSWPALCVKACDACGDTCVASEIYNAQGTLPELALNGRELRMATVFMSDLLVERRIFVPNFQAATVNGHVRYLDRFTNETMVPITVTVYLGSVSTTPTDGQIASGGVNVIRTHHLDDSEVDVLDRWVALDDGQVNGGSPALGAVSWGGGGQRPFLHTVLKSEGITNLRWGFRLTVPGNETVSLLSAIVIEPNRIDVYEELETLLKASEVGLLAGMTNTERNSVVNFDIAADNAAPVAHAGGPYTVSEGSSVALTALESHDPEAGNLDYGWHFDPTDQLDAPFDLTGANVTRVFTDDGLYQVRLTVTDPGMKSDRVFAGVRVNNVSPSIDSFTTSSPISEGDPLLIRVVASDPGDDELSCHLDYENRGLFEGDVAFESQRVYMDDGLFTLRVMVRDDDGGIIIDETTVEVLNAAPEVLQIVVSPEVGEGSDVPVSIIAQDPGDDPMTYALDLDGDDIFEIELGDDNRWTVNYPDNGFFQVQARVCDDEGLCGTKVTSVSVRNVAPVIRDVAVSGQLLEAQPVTFTVDAVDSTADTSELTYGFDFDNDGDFSDDVVQSSAVTTHVFNTAGVYRIGVRVSDADGGVATTVVDVEIGNVPPTVTMAGPQTALEGEQVIFTCAGLDVGNAFLAIDWDLTGDGIYERSNARDVIEYAFPDEGTYRVRCRVRDGLGAQAFAEQTIYISNVRPSVTVDFGMEFFEGSEVFVRAVATDVAGDRLTYQFDFDGDGLPDAGPSEQSIGRHIYPDEGVYTVQVWVSDQTDEIRVSGTVTVLNRPPNALVILPDNVDEGDTVTARVEVSDPGGDPVLLSWDLDGDGDAEVEDVVPVVGGIAERQFVVADDGPLNVAVWARDDEGDETQATASLLVRNIAPALFEGYTPLPATEGRQYASVIPVFDPAGANDPLTYQLLAGPETIDLDPSTGLLLWTPTYEEYLASPTAITLRVSDGDNGVLETNLEIIVNARDEDQDGLPDTYEERTCDTMGACLDPTNPNDSSEDLDNDGLTNLEEWAGGTNPFEYDGPKTPMLLSPLDEARVNTPTPTLEVEMEPYRGPLAATIRFEVYTDEQAMDVMLSAQEPVGEDPIVTHATDATEWVEDMRYFWRARAETPLSTSDWTPIRNFRVNAENTAPPAPLPLSPEDDVTLGERSPEFVVRTVTDPDGDSVKYLFRFYRENGDIETLGYGESDTEFVRFSQPLREGVTLFWEVLAIDEVGAQSEPSERRRFVVDALNNPPTAPDVISPEVDMILSKNPIEVTVGGSLDPDGHEFSYGLALYAETSTPLLSSSVTPDEEGVARFIATEVVTEDRAYDLVAYAEDEFGARSESTVRRIFVSSENDPPSAPTPIEPINFAPILPAEAVFFWGQSVDPEGSVVTYRLTICTSELALDTKEGCVIEPLLQTNGFDFRTDAKSGQEYFWFVEALDADGTASNPSETWSFRVIDSDEDEAGCDCRFASTPTRSLWVLLLMMTMIAHRRSKRVLH